MFSSKSNTNFSGLCKEITDNLERAREAMKKMPTDEIYALKEWADQQRSVGAKIWADAELQRRDFLLKQWSMVIALLAFFISVAALFSAR